MDPHTAVKSLLARKLPRADQTFVRAMRDVLDDRRPMTAGQVDRLDAMATANGVVDDSAPCAMGPRVTVPPSEPLHLRRVRARDAGMR